MHLSVVYEANMNNPSHVCIKYPALALWVLLLSLIPSAGPARIVKTWIHAVPGDFEEQVYYRVGDGETLWATRLVEGANRSFFRLVVSSLWASSEPDPVPMDILQDYRTSNQQIGRRHVAASDPGRSSKNI